MGTTGTSSRTTGGRRQSKTVSFVYGGVSTVLLLVIATIALVVQPPAPPALAEFAPQAEQRIEEAPDQQSSQFSNTGTGACAAGQQDCSEGGTGAGLGSGTTTTLPRIAGDGDDGDDGDGRTIIDKRRVRRCVGDPPRQIEDPQSPPCVAYWEGDNGGATSPGVTRDEIRVVFNRQRHFQDHEDVVALVEFFNRRFEFYGRKIRFIVKGDVGFDGGRVDLQDKASAGAAEAGAFAALGQATERNVEHYRRNLARNGIISVMVSETATTEEELQRYHPYLWNYQLPYDRLGRDFAEFACKSLATPGARADHAGGLERGKPRKFAIVRQLGYESHTMERMGDTSALLDGLRACNVPFITAEFDSQTQNNQARTLLSDLRARDVTNIVVVATVPNNMARLMDEASRLAYQPEWTMLGGGGYDFFSEEHYQRRAPDQVSHLMALMGWNKILPVSDRPATWAYDEVGVMPDSRGNQREAMESYQGLLLIASGIQAAGPNLTPETFAKGLQSLKFPNPGAGAAPYYQASVGFAGDHSMVDDEAVVWWSPSAPAYFSLASETGGWCYIDKGARWRYGHWPRRQVPLFSQTADCR